MELIGFDCKEGVLIDIYAFRERVVCDVCDESIRVFVDRIHKIGYKKL